MDIENAVGERRLNRTDDMIEFRVADIFSSDLGGRYKKNGPYSGEVFRRAHLIPLVDRAISSGQIVRINFDGVSGTPTSFLEEAFGGLLRERPEWTLDQVKNSIRLEAPCTPLLRPYMTLAMQYLERQAIRRLQH